MSGAMRRYRIRGCARGLAITFALLLWACGPGARADFCPPQSPQSDGMRDIMLVYANTNGWRQENFLPYVAYLDRGGRPRDWFYDAYLFMMFSGAPSGQTYIEGHTNRKDWEFYLDEEFAPGREFAALDATIDGAAREMCVSAPRVPVIVMVPYPSTKQKDFGDADGDGATENLSTDEGRGKAVAWFLREFVGRWKGRGFRNLKLWGFYWMNEGISPSDEGIVRMTAKEVHSLGYKFHWIPWFNAPGVEKWRELGFDLTIMQPNYAFIPPFGLRQIPDENRLTVAANMCRRLGMGIEMELNMGIDMDAKRMAPIDPRDRINLQLYLDHGDDSLDGYQRGAVRAYYQGYNAIAGLCHSGDPALRRLYDDLYQFHKGTYQRRRPYQPLDTADKCLADGLWNTRPDSRAAAIKISGPNAALTFPLGGARLVGDVRVHFQTGPAPTQVSLALDRGGEDDAFEEVATEDNIVLSEKDGGGFAVLTFPARLARRIRLNVDMARIPRLSVDEVLLMPASHLLCGYPYDIGPGATDPARCLTDGVMGGDDMAVWHGDRGEVRLTLPEERHAESLLVHFRRASDKSFSPRASVDAAAGMHPADKDGMALVPLDRPIRRIALTVEDPAAGAIAADEVALLPTRNLAAGCSYTYDPPFRAQYPDSGGRELTDGQTSEGFGDGKTVGWAKWSMARDVSIVLDIGTVRAVDAIEVHVQGGGYANVEFPERVTTAVSEDGSKWTWAAVSGGEPAQTKIREVGGSRSALGWLSVRTPGARGRFIRLRLMPKGWLMLSEIRVLSGGTNVASHQPYSIQPQPTGEEKYADNSNLLTDGFLARAGSGWKACAGLIAADPTVELDLGATHRIGTARVHVHGGGPGGVYFPERISVAISSDGKSWESVGETREHPAEDGKASAATFMGLTFEPRDARFLRFQAIRHGWVMIDEIEVFPARPAPKPPHQSP